MPTFKLAEPPSPRSQASETPGPKHQVAFVRALVYFKLMVELQGFYVVCYVYGSMKVTTSARQVVLNLKSTLVLV